jgi:sporulation protein YlmC with PRC-barrel domain
MNRAPRTIDAYMSLMDRQILANDGTMLGKVDDLELEQRADGRLYVTALLRGPGVLGPRLGGALGTIVRGTWARLSGRTEPSRIVWSQVAQLTSAVELGVSAETVGVDGFERWVRDRFIAALPGAGVDPE